MIKVLFLLALSCASAFAADPALQQFSLAKTNGDAVFTWDVFTRNGETNLVRSTVTRNGAVESRFHKFYYSGALVAEHWSFADSSGFITEASLPYSMIFKSSPSNTVTAAYICTEDRIVVDYFTATNGVFWPVDTYAVQEARKMTTEIHRQASPAPQ